MRNKVLLVVGICLCITGASANAQDKESSGKARAGLSIAPLSFREVPIGVPGQKEVLEKMCLDSNQYEESCRRIKPDVDQHFHTLGFGNIKNPDIQYRIGEDGALNYLAGIGSNQELLVLSRLLAEKYGKPKKERSILSWKDRKGNVLMIVINAIDVNKGAFMFFSASEDAKSIHESSEDINEARRKL